MKTLVISSRTDQRPGPAKSRESLAHLVESADSPQCVLSLSFHTRSGVVLRNQQTNDMDKNTHEDNNDAWSHVPRHSSKEDHPLLVLNESANSPPHELNKMTRVAYEQILQ